MRAVGRVIVATALLSVGLWSVAADTASAAPKKQTIVVRVVDQDGAPRASASAVACPVIGGQQDCSQAEGMETNAAGYAHLKLDTNVTYGVFSFVSNPEPAWACPGFVIGDQQLYLSERIEALGSDVPRTVTFTIAEPSPLDCAVVTVTDDSGNPLPTAGLFVCAHAQGSADCIGSPFEGADGDGVIRMKIDANLVYDLGTFIANTGWPCPGFTAPDGTLFHFGESGSFTADDFLNGVTLVIPVPGPEDCVQILITDDSGNPLANGGIDICAHFPGSSECTGPTNWGSDQNGIVTLRIDPALIYDLRAWDTNTGWPCPSGVLPDGTTFHYGERASYTATDLIAGVTLVVPIPSADDCVVIGVTDDAGNPLSTAGLFVCAHQPGSTACIGEPFEGADPDGVIRMAIDPELIYDLGTFIANTGWPCPGFVGDDGTAFHFGESGTFTADDLLDGVTLVIPVPSPEDCVHVLITDDSGTPLPHSTIWICAHLPGSADCVGIRDWGADQNGVVTLAIDPTLVYDLRPVANNTGWPCPSTVFPDGSTFHTGEVTSFTAADLLAGVTLVVPVPSPDDCVVIAVTDDAGNPLPTAGLFVCAHAPGSAECIGERFEGADPDGVIRMAIDPELVYDLGTFIANTGWPCPGFVGDDGTAFHFGESGTFTADDLLNGVTLVIAVPKPDDCAA